MLSCNQFWNNLTCSCLANQEIGTYSSGLTAQTTYLKGAIGLPSLTTFKAHLSLVWVWGPQQGSFLALCLGGKDHMCDQIFVVQMPGNSFHPCTFSLVSLLAFKI